MMDRVKYTIICDVDRCTYHTKYVIVFIWDFHNRKTRVKLHLCNNHYYNNIEQVIDKAGRLQTHLVKDLASRNCRHKVILKSEKGVPVLVKNKEFPK